MAESMSWSHNPDEKFPKASLNFSKYSFLLRMARELFTLASKKLLRHRFNSQFFCNKHPNSEILMFRSMGSGLMAVGV